MSSPPRARNDVVRGNSARLRRNLGLLARYSVVGATGVLVNLVALVLVSAPGPGVNVEVLSLPFGDFHVRWYHVYSTIAFLVANLWNFQLNRSWTFRSSGFASWRREYLPFLSVGLVAQGVGLLLLTLLMHPGSPLSLPTEAFGGSPDARARLYAAQLIVIAAVTPLSFAVNRVWTFAATRSHLA